MGQRILVLTSMEILGLWVLVLTSREDDWRFWDSWYIYWPPGEMTWTLCNITDH